MDYNWIAIGILMCGGGYVLITGLIKGCREDLKHKCGTLGYRLYKGTISSRRAYWNCLITLMSWPFVLSGTAAAFAGYGGLPIWETLIVGMTLTLPPAIAQINPFLKKSAAEAEARCKDD